MSVKDDIVRIFEKERGAFLSGEELAERLGVSRSAVWKAVRQLETEGYKFEAVSGRGYSLSPDSDVISREGIMKYLGEIGAFTDIRTFRTVTSTNPLLRELASQGAPEGTVLVAAGQTAGKGRMNRRFSSPEGTGVYLSILFRPKMMANEALFITTAAAVAVARTIEELSGRTAGIKWVNDVFIDGRKVCGILTEASFDTESGYLEYAVCGIGVNISPPEGGFPEEIRNIAGAVFDGEPVPDARNRMAAGIIRRLTEYYRAMPEHPFFDEYVRRSVILGKEILVLSGGDSRRATAVSIDRNCNLLVRYEDGSEQSLASGEVSIRKC